MKYWLSSDYDSAPNDMLKGEMINLRAALSTYIDKFNYITATEIISFNKLAGENNAPVLIAGPPIKIPN